jgi:20S proteasome alpha/beta subunit
MQDVFISNGKDIKLVTVGIALVCSDGVVIGADRKVTMSRGTRIKSLESKIFTLAFRDGKQFLVCVAGSIDHAKRAMLEINPCNLDTLDCSKYRDMVESNISRLRWRLSDRGLTYDATLLFGMIDIGNRPVIGHIMPSGLVEVKYDGYFTAGIAAPYAEIVLKDSYEARISVEDAKLIVGG